MIPYRRANTPNISLVSREEKSSVKSTQLCTNSVVLNNVRTFKMFESAHGLNDSIVELLKCPICYESMVTPIFMCMNGHNICQNCRLKVSACPTCKCHLGDIRNRFAETIAEKVTYLCRYVKRGCRELLSIADKFSHEEECASRPCICRICASWCGEFNELLEHVRAAHLHRIRNEDINTVHCKYFNENTSSELVVLVTFQGEMFWWHSKRDVQSRMFYEVLQYIGDKEEALKFRYRHKFTTAFGDQQIIITNRTFPESTNVKNLYNSRKCLTLEFDRLKNYLNENTLSFEFEIKRTSIKKAE